MKSYFTNNLALGKSDHLEEENEEDGDANAGPSCENDNGSQDFVPRNPTLLSISFLVIIKQSLLLPILLLLLLWERTISYAATLLLSCRKQRPLLLLISRHYPLVFLLPLLHHSIVFLLLLLNCKQFAASFCNSVALV